jgi:protein-disulfide isomerase
MSRKKREKRSRAHKDAHPVTTSSTTSAPSADGNKESRRGGGVNRLGLIVAIVGFVGLFGLVLFLGDGPPPPAETAFGDGAPDEPERSDLELWQAAFVQEVPVTERDYSRGPVDAPVSIVEFSDFECPFCKVANEHLRNVVERYPSDVRLVYKNFPLDVACNADVAQQIHPFGCKSAVMARCASPTDPELFWRFHDAVFELEDISDEALDKVASTLGVNDERFANCVTGSDTFDEVRNDVALARSLGVEATPTVFVNGKVAPSYNVDSLSEIVDHILATQ